MKNKKMKHLHLIIILILSILIGNSCSKINSRKLNKLVAEYEEAKRRKQEEIKETAHQYIKTKIPNSQLLNRINYDTIFQQTMNLVVYNVNDKKGLLENNMILVFVNNELEIDTINTKIDLEEIALYVENPKDYKLMMSQRGLLKIAKQEKFEKGIKPWKIRLHGNSLKDLRWNITNTLKETNRGSYKARGKTLRINVINKEITYTSWNAIS